MASLKTILVVEDDEMTAWMILELLRLERGHGAINASDARATFACIATVQPDLLIIDYYLPDINGLELYHQLQQQEGWQQTPVIFLSAILTQDDMRQHQVVGLEKPFEVEDLLVLVDQLLAENVEIVPMPEPVIDQAMPGNHLDEASYN